MKSVNALWFSIRALVLRSRADAEIDEELAFHIEREAAMYERDGMSRADARREALRQFGGLQRYRDECRDVRRTSLLDDAIADVRHALRLIRLRPGFSANVVAISALGVIACTTTFSIVSGVLLSPLPFPHPERIASLDLQGSDGSLTAAVPIDLYQRIAGGSRVIEAIGASYPSATGVDWNGEPENAHVQFVTPSFLRVFGVAPALGRSFTAEEADAHAPVVLLGDAAWHARFSADPTVIGKRLALDGVPHTIVGVMPPIFRAHMLEEPSLWRPMTVVDARAKRNGTVNPMVRLADGVTRASAEAWLATLGPMRIESNTGADSVAATPSLVPITERIFGYTKKPLLVLLGAVLLVLLLVAANVATMFLARSAARLPELRVRRALGASTGRQIRQLVTESSTLTAIGGAIGVVASYWTVGVVRGLGFRVLPRVDSMALDWRVMAFAVAATMLTGAVGGLAPAFMTRGGALDARDTSKTRVTGQRTSSALIVVQITLSVVLLVGAGLLLKSFLRIVPTAPGFALENRAILSVELTGKSWFPDTDRVAARRFIHDVTERMQRVSGVTSVGVMSFAPFTGSVSSREVRLPGRPASGTPLRAFHNVISPNFFDVMGMPILRGRAFTGADDEGRERVVVINETAARRWWPGENPIGRQISVEDLKPFVATVVGVAHDARTIGQDTKVRSEIFLPVAQSHPRYVTFVAHTAIDPRSIARELRRALWSVAPQMPITTSTDLATIASESVRRTRFFSTAMSFFAAASVMLCALAVYGLLAFAVVQRRREFGIRLALGATPRRVGAQIIRNALLLGGAGVGLGLLLARVLSKYMESVLIEVNAHDATVFLATAVGMLGVAVIAACVPAMQAIRVDPVRSLREG